MSARRWTAAAAMLCVGALGACGGSTGTPGDVVLGEPTGTSPPIVDAASPPSSGADSDTAAADGGDAPKGVDAAAPPAIDASLPPDPSDGPQTPATCSQLRGRGMSGAYGRLDGFVSSVRCGRVDDHLHLQVRMNGEVYDVAINLDTLYAERDVPMPAGAWSEGWHTTGVSLDYPTSFGLHAGDFTLAPTTADLATRLQQELADANHISIFAQGYDSSDGAHDVHRRGRGGIDGAIVIRPLAPVAHVVLFRFSTDNF